MTRGDQFSFQSTSNKKGEKKTRGAPRGNKIISGAESEGKAKRGGALQGKEISGKGPEDLSFFRQSEGRRGGGIFRECYRKGEGEFQSTS